VLFEAALAGGVGLVLGLCFRAPAVLIASYGLAVAGATVAPFAGGSLWASVTVLGVMLLALQIGYLAGLILGCAVVHWGADLRVQRPQGQPSLRSKRATGLAE
jgi:hypothetical protein